MDSLDEIYALMEEVKDMDIRGDVYEYLRSKIAQSGLNVFASRRNICKKCFEH